MSILSKKVRLDSLKIDGTHIEICTYSTQMSKLNQIKAKTRLEKKTNQTKNQEKCGNGTEFFFLLKKQCLFLHPGI